MISAMHIHGYRGFDHFEMDGMGPITLFVGTNNSGKTSVLEALYLLATGGDPSALWTLLNRRGERLFDDRDQRRPQLELDVCHLFRGHRIQVDSEFHLVARNDVPERKIRYSIAEMREQPKQEQLFFPDEDGDLFGPGKALRIDRGTPSISVEIPLTRRDGLVSEAIEVTRGITRVGREQLGPAQFISTDSLSAATLVRLWDTIALTDSESIVLNAIRCLDPTVERIASLSASKYFGFGSRGGFIIKQEGSEYPVPIGSMGDGMWRMLAMAIAIVRAKGGVLLVDEIDTGLHYTAMASMWRLIYKAAAENNVQVFATTHSYDCVQSLASICDEGAAENSHVTIHRIEPGRSTSIPYSEAQIRLAADEHIEIR